MQKTPMLRRLPASLLAAFAGSVMLASTAVAQSSASYPTVTPPQTATAGAGAPAAAGPTTMLTIEQKLDALGYDVGPVDGVTDAQTHSAIMAFQKVHGLERTGGLTDPVTNQIVATQSPPPPMVPDGEPNRVEVSLSRQVLFLYENGTLSKIVSVSSGTSETPTPTGTFRIYRQSSGWHTSRLGRLYNAQYFVGGYAIHGSLSVPAQPASHGCIRLPMTAAEWFPSKVGIGTQVVILD
jgi:lipoprotein-anchoring transpeptidase ErfK/SrfK